MGTYNQANSPSEYTTAIEYDISDNPIYIGEAKAGTAKNVTGWRIKKLTYSGSNCTDIQWADGTPAFSKIYDSRAGYSYS